MSKNKEYTAKMKREYKEKMKAKAKERKQRLKEKRSRLVIKNLPFNVTEEKLRSHFEQYGRIVVVQLLKKEDGSKVGCGFVQFEAVQKAAKAKHYMNGKKFMGRLIECDFTMPKKSYDKKVWKEKAQKLLTEQEIKKEPMDADVKKENPEEEETKMNEDDGDIVEVKDECSKEEHLDNVKKGDEEESSDDDKDDASSDEDKGEETSDDEKDSEMDEEDEDEDSDGDDSGVHEVKEEKDLKINSNKQRYESHDVNEGKTIFIKNVPFDASNDQLKQCMRQFGPVYYALICVDKQTEHSKGTAFVKFVNKEDADQCLQAGTELTLLDQILDCHKAIDRKEVLSKAEEKERAKQKDSRNLYLVKEGVIMAGTKAAEGVSASDMAKRLQIEQYKTQMLRNLNMFVSKTRFVIHNLPPTWDDSKLRALIKKHASPGAIIKEARIMRNMMKVDSKGIGESKEYGFVSFATHEQALNTLRSLNNNPKVFTENKRPIISFSIENRNMVNARQKRMERSRQMNPLAKNFDPEVKKKVQEKRQKAESNEVSEGQEYSGLLGKPGVVQKMRSRYKLKTQALIHKEQLKKEKKQKKVAPKTLKEKREDFIRQDGQKLNKNKKNREALDDNFAKMVNSYKSKLLQGNSNNLQKRGVWTDS